MDIDSEDIYSEDLDIDNEESAFDTSDGNLTLKKGYTLDVNSSGITAIKIPSKKEIYNKNFRSLYNIILTRKDSNNKPIRRITIDDIELISNFVLEYYNIITASENDTIFVYDDSQGIFINTGDIFLKRDVEFYLKEFVKSESVNEILNKIRRKTYQSINVFVENSKDFVCLKNGVWCFSQHKLLDHSPEYKFINRLPIIYNPDARCNKIATFFNSIVYPDKVQLLYELFGFCLIPEYKIQKAGLLIGSGRNGKSVYLNLLKCFLGKDNVSNQSIQKLSKDKFSSYQLFGKIANIFPDLSSEEIGDSSTFKALTSGLDSISAEQKFKNSFDFINHAKLLFSCNQIPKSRDDSDAFYRRWVIIIFPFTFEGSKDNKNLITELTTDEELSGLLNIAIEYSYRLIEEGEFTSSQTTDEVREIYTRLSDSVGSFILDKIDISPEDFISKEELYTKFVEYCRSFKFPVLSEKMFNSLIFQKMPVTNFRPIANDGSRPMSWRGIGWKVQEDQISIKKDSI